MERVVSAKSSHNINANIEIYLYRKNRVNNSVQQHYTVRNTKKHEADPKLTEIVTPYGYDKKERERNIAVL